MLQFKRNTPYVRGLRSHKDLIDCLSETQASYSPLVVDRNALSRHPLRVVASGGAGTLEHMADVLEQGRADAVLAASIFHFGEFTVPQAKAYMAARGIEVRL